MATVKIYGAQTSRYEYFKNNLVGFMDKYGLDVEVQEIKDVNRIIEDDVVSIPTLRINSHVDIVYNDHDGINKFVSDSKEQILSEFAPDLLTKVLVPIDFSDASLNALEYAVNLSKKIGAEIEVLYVNHPSPLVVNGRVIVDEITVANRKLRLNAIVDETIENIGVTAPEEDVVIIKEKYLEGLAGDEIIRLSQEKDLIIMGTTGESVAKKLLGSVSSKVSSKAKCPALFVPANAKFLGLDNIAYAYSPTSYDHKVINDVLEVAKKHNSTLHLVHVNDGGAFESYDIESYLEHMNETVKVKWEEIESANVPEGIVQYAGNLEADLIILSKKKRNLLERVIEKSATKETLMKTNIPVMVYHKDDIGCLCGGACRKKPEANCNH